MHCSPNVLGLAQQTFLREVSTTPNRNTKTWNKGIPFLLRCRTFWHSLPNIVKLHTSRMASTSNCLVASLFSSSPNMKQICIHMCIVDVASGFICATLFLLTFLFVRIVVVGEWEFSDACPHHQSGGQLSLMPTALQPIWQCYGGTCFR